MSQYRRTPPPQRRANTPNDFPAAGSSAPADDFATQLASIRLSPDQFDFTGRTTQEMVDAFLSEELETTTPSPEWVRSFGLLESIQKNVALAMGQALLRMLQPTPVAEIDALVGWCMRVKARLHAA